ncbi:MAG TPA: subclass B1 metallo-beta-lactamase [Candidatus Eisenbacteria bacterium]|nr:subclass B1 metallo-beta-lactamase [Candidatus Eisenbacteria bacterium]
MAPRALLALLSGLLIACNPARAEDGLPRPNATVELDSLAPGVWIHTSYYTYPNGSRFSSNGLVVRDGDGLTLIDTAWGERSTSALLDRIERDIKLPVRQAFVTHAHGDRISGADVLRDRGIPVRAHPRTMALALEVGLPPPSDSLPGLEKAGSFVSVGTVEIFYPGPGHSPENLMVWVPAENVLFGGCAVRPADATTLGNTAHADRQAWSHAIDRAGKRYGAPRIVVPGHGAVGGPELLPHTLTLLRHRP